MLKQFPLLLCVLLAVGCAQTKSGTFDVLVRNQTTTPLSVGFVKNGPPNESAWTSPELIAFSNPALTGKHWGTLVQPGQTCILGPQYGEFARGTIPYVRVYRGDLPINELLAIDRTSPDRTTVPLPPGKGVITVTDDKGHLTAEYARPPS